MTTQELEQGKKLSSEIFRLQELIRSLGMINLSASPPDLVLNQVYIPEEFLPSNASLEVLIVEIKERAQKKLDSLKNQFDNL